MKRIDLNELRAELEKGAPIIIERPHEDDFVMVYPAVVEYGKAKSLYGDFDWEFYPDEFESDATFFLWEEEDIKDVIHKLKRFVQANDALYNTEDSWYND